MGCAALYWFLLSLLTGQLLGRHRVETPAQLKQPRITAGKEFLSQSRFIELGVLESVKGIGVINDVAVVESDSHPDLEVVIAGHAGAIVYDRNGTRQNRMLFQFPTEKVKVGPLTSEKTLSRLGQVQVVDLEGDGITEYLARGSLDGAAVFDHQGRMLWHYGKYSKEKMSISDLTVGDLDGDHVAEFVASWHGIEVFDQSGRRKSQVQEVYSDAQIEVVDADGDGKNEIVSCGESLKIRDSTGRVIKSVGVPVYLGNFCISEMPGRKQPVILGVQDGRLWLIDFNGQVVAQFDAPLSTFYQTVHQGSRSELRGTSVFKSKGIWVKLAKDQPEYLVVITEFAGIDRSVLDVFTPGGKLAYQEVLPEDCLSIALLPPEDQSGVEEFLVGGERTVWRYRSGKSQSTGQ
jgi:hypothetical protein